MPYYEVRDGATSRLQGTIFVPPSWERYDEVRFLISADAARTQFTPPGTPDARAFGYLTLKFDWFRLRDGTSYRVLRNDRVPVDFLLLTKQFVPADDAQY